MTAPVIAWDFDGVLNANIRDGRFLWADRFEPDTGHALDRFQKMVFGEAFEAVLTGREDIRDRVSQWADTVGYAPGADALLEYWFTRDMMPDAQVLSLVDRWRARGVRNVMATNNEWRRTAAITAHEAFGARLDHIFAAGPMGAAKPDPRFFHIVTESLGVAPGQMILIDDHPDNIDAASALGWVVFHFTEATRADLPAFLDGKLGGCAA